MKLGGMLLGLARLYLIDAAIVVIVAVLVCEFTGLFLSFLVFVVAVHACLCYFYSC